MKAISATFAKLQPGILLSVLGVCVVLYFAYHFVQGESGIRALLDYQNRVEQTRQTLESIKSKRLQLEHRVSLLRSDNLDPDLLEERARAVLNYAHPDEIAIVIR
jgi:cell division protein FtsB